MSRNNIGKQSFITIENKHKLSGSKFSREEESMDQTITKIWSLVIFISNLRALFWSIFWASADDTPSGFFLFCEVFFEYILLLEILYRVFMRKKWNLKLYHVEPPESLFYLGLLLFSSFPIFNLSLFVYKASPSAETSGIFGYLGLIKLIRALIEVLRYLNAMQERMFYRNVILIVYLKLIQSLAFVIYFAHLSACLWQFVQKTHSDSKCSIYV